MVFFPGTGQAQDIFEWAAAVNGSWGDNARWNKISGLGNPPPGVDDEARFNETGTYTVTFPSSVNSGELVVSAGNVTFRSAGTDQQYRLSQDAFVRDRSELTLGAAGDSLDLSSDLLWITRGGTVNILHGSEVSTGDALIASASLIVDGAESFFRAPGIAINSFDASGRLILRNGARGNLNGPVTLDALSTDAASLTVESGAELEFNATLRVGHPDGTDGSGGTVTATVAGGG
ncbi:MAG TPA: hypothetical protein VF175_05505, partial [Lacipirellula sp.]